jgi:hypothetical protein
MDSEVLNPIPHNRPKVQPLPSTVSTIKPTGRIKTDPIPISESSNFNGPSTKTVRIGGFFGKKYTVKKVGDKIVYEKVIKQATFKPSSPSSQITSSPNSAIKTKNPPSFSICPQCGRQINPNISDKCSNCGFRIK